MRIKRKLFISLCVLTLLLTGAFSGAATAKGDKPERLDGKIISEPTAQIQSMTALTLQESLNPTAGPWTQVYGNLANGYTMVLSGASAMEYLDVATLSATPALANGDYPFKLDPARVPDGFIGYWSAQGVISGATGWQGLMWEIINGSRPMFYLRVSPTGFDLIDGLAYAMSPTPSLVTDPVRINGDYPLHTYNFEGTVLDALGGSQTLVVGITFTHAVTTSLRIDSAVVNPIVIDGCGYVDVVIHLSGVQNLYALDLSLTFDTTELEVIDQDAVLAGVNLLPKSPWSVSTQAYIVSNIADNNAGTIRFISSLLNSYGPINGEVDVAVIRLRAKAVGSGYLSITGMVLTDRDGYLVGLPLTTPISYPVTTQFTAVGGLDLGIIRKDALNVELSWFKQALDPTATYTLYKHSLPYFNTTDAGVVPITGTFTDTGTKLTYSDPVLGNVVTNYFYTMKITCSNLLTSEPAWWVGKFDFQLYESFEENDFTWVGLVLDTTMVPPLEDASDLEYHIEHYNNSATSSVDVLTISVWNPSGQTFSIYPGYDFPLQVGQAYQVEISTTGFIGTVWSQVGKLPVQETFSYTLYESFEETDFNWVLQPLDFVTINNVAGLLANLEANSSNNSLEVLTISEWGNGQSYTIYNGLIGNFSTRFGYPYLVEIQFTDFSFGPANWPVSR